MMIYIVDRLEDKYAILEDENRKIIEILLLNLPEGVKESDVLVKVGEKYVFDRNEFDLRKENIEELMDDLWE